MRTEEIKIYKFDELSEEAKERAVNRLCDINVGYNWWDCVYDDAEMVGIKITSFELGRGSEITGEFMDGPVECFDLIDKNHGKECETYKTAHQYMKDRDNLVYKYSDKVNTEAVAEDNEAEFDEDCDELEREFLAFILADYLTMLRKDCEYRESEEAIIETIQGSEYEFTEDGKIY